MRKRVEADSGLHEACGVFGMYQAFPVHREIDQQLAVPSDAPVVYFRYLFRGLDHVVLLGVVEPSPADGYVALCGDPNVPVLVSGTEFIPVRVSRIDDSFPEERPVGF